MKNPFTPNFGQIPVRMAGRDMLIDEISAAFESGFGDPNLSTILIGARGTGKTALLSLLANEAEARGWIAVEVTSSPGMLEDIVEQALRKASHLLNLNEERRLKAISLAQVIGFEWDNPVGPRGNWRTRMTSILEALNEIGVGLLITVDEVEPTLDEMAQLVTVYQHFVREGRKASLIMAGLPHNVSSLISGKSTSFLRRACQHRLIGIEDHEVAEALRQTIESSQKSINDEALNLATASIEGFPFMMQLVGYRAWQLSGERCSVTLQDVARGIEMARGDMRMRVLKPTLDELSDRDLEFIEAMLQDERISLPAEIGRRLGKSPAHVSSYKRRLLDQGVIQERGRGKIEFAIPMLREYLPEYLEDSL